MVGKVLVVDDVATNRIVMKVRLSAAGYQPLVAPDGAACLAMARAERPDLLLLDLMLPDMPGAEVIARLRADLRTRELPIVVVTASRDAQARLAALRAGADDVMDKPVDEALLLARIRRLLRAREAMAGLDQVTAGLPAHALAEAAEPFVLPARIALVLARPDRGLHMRRGLTTRVRDMVLPLTPDEALAMARQDAAVPDVFVIEADLPISGGGLRLMSDLQSRTGTCNSAFALLMPTASAGAAAMALDLGADDLLMPDCPVDEMVLRLARLVRRKREAERKRLSVQDGLRMAVIDPLTGLHNRRYGLAELQRIAEAATAAGRPFAVLVADIDRFKTINDRFGHAAGDEVLIEVARRLRQNLRLGDLLARIGGEEFLIALPDVDLAEAGGIAQRLCRAVEAEIVATGPTRGIGVTVSIGLALCAPGSDAALTTLVERADRALLEAKAGGRNQVTVSRSAA